MPRAERFQALARTIIFQQLAGAAANAIYNRFVGLFPGAPFPSAEQVLAVFYCLAILLVARANG